jgi:hypothetical protein
MNVKLAKLRALSWPERRVLLTAMFLLPIFWVGVRLVGLPRLCGSMNLSPVVSQPRDSRDDPAAISTLVNIAANHVWFPSTCLTRSLVLNWLLHRRGVRSELRIGVRLIQGRLDAHAWVEYQARPVNDTPDVSERFAAFDGPLSPKLFISP